MKIKFRLNAGPDERFGPNAFANRVGESFAFNRGIEGETGVLLGFEVVDDGRSVVLEIEVPDLGRHIPDDSEPGRPDLEGLPEDVRESVAAMEKGAMHRQGRSWGW